jgi:fatty-acyl-CoA synthase
MAPKDEGYMLGQMQDWDLRVTHLIDYAAREHGSREILTRWADGSIERTNWGGVAMQARKLAQAFHKWGMKPGDRIATFAMKITTSPPGMAQLAAAG